MVSSILDARFVIGNFEHKFSITMSVLGNVSSFRGIRIIESLGSFLKLVPAGYIHFSLQPRGKTVSMASLRISKLVLEEVNSSNRSNTTMLRKKLSEGYWLTTLHRRRYFDALGGQLSMKSLDNWYDISRNPTVVKTLRVLLKPFGQSWTKALAQAYPEQEWQFWRFRRVPHGFWFSKSNQLQLFHFLETKFGIEKPSDWYKISRRQFEDMGAMGALVPLGTSFIKTLANVYPNHPWNFWNFKKTVNRYWNDRSNVESYLKWLCSELKVSQCSDLKCLSRRQVSLLKGASLINKYGGLQTLLSTVFPFHNRVAEMLPGRILSSSNKEQQHLSRTLKELFSVSSVESDIRLRNDIPMYVNFRNSVLRYEISKRTMELDVFLPSFHLGFEYQGIQHYDSNLLKQCSNNQTKRDKEKLLKCEQSGITLISVPYCWDGRAESIASRILNHRPDLRFTLSISNSMLPIENIVITTMKYCHYPNDRVSGQPSFLEIPTWNSI